ncbi:MAG: ABC transporter permease [Bacillota bacterium]|nr:ABC transporter permease [Negativicutes bacterium]
MLTDIWTVFWRDWLVLRRRLGRFILSRMITPILYLVTFGWGLGKSVLVFGTSYLDFIFPGIIALNSMNISFNAVSSPVNMSRLHYKTLEEYLIAPISPFAYIAGKIISGTVRGLISSVVIILLGVSFGAHFAVTGWFVLVLTLNCLQFSAFGLLAALLINSHEELANFNTYFLLPMSFLAATFFTVDKLPAFLRAPVELLPLTHASYALRTLGMGGTVPWLSVLVICLYILGFSAAGWWAMKRVNA